MQQPWLKHAELVGERVLLRPVGPADVPICFDLVHGQRAITDWLIWDGPESIEEIAPWYLTWPLGDPTRGCDYHFAIVDREDGAFSGSISVRFHDHPFQGDVGYWVGLDKQGRGFGGEAVRLVTWLGFEHLGAELLYAEWFEGNTASQRVLERAGYEQDPVGETTVLKRGRQVRTHFHACSRSTWLAAGRPGEPPEVRVIPGEAGGPAAE